jgi:pimeloyl-ACP methyl ester carboxylesterase
VPPIAHDVVGAGPPVVFIHGLTSSRQAWTPITDLLSGEFTCVRVDLRGHGETPPADDYSMVSIVGDVRELVDELGLERPVLVGNSLGATVAAVYAAAHDVRAVVCVDQPLRFGDFAERFVQPRAEELRSERTMEVVLDIDRELGLEPYAGIAEVEQRILAFPREVVLGIWDALLTTPPEQLTATAQMVLQQITAPLLALHGAPTAPGYDEWLRRVVPSAEIEVWDGMGHLLHLVDPERFAGRVRTWIAASTRA